MSFILDALKKSETERQQQGPAEFASVPSSNESPGVPRWLWVLGFLLAVNLVVLTGLLLRDDTRKVLPEPAVPDVAVGDPAPASTADDSFEERLDAARDQRPASTASTGDGMAAAEPTVATAPAANPAPRPSLRVLSTADELRANGTLQMPELHLDIHVYSDTPSDRFVFINMVRHQENSKLTEGPVVREITPEGVILDYSGTEFLLPRE